MSTLNRTRMRRFVLVIPAHHAALLGLVVATMLASSCVPLPPATQPLDARTGAREPAPTALVGMPNESSGLIQADSESLEDFLARIAVAESAYWPPEALLVYSVVNDARNLRRGVSVRPADALRCWVHQEQSLTPCQGQDVQENLGAHRDSSAPTVYFAITASDAAEMLVMYDVHDPRDPGDTIDGYRVVLRHRDGRWHEESLQWTY